MYFIIINDMWYFTIIINKNFKEAYNLFSIKMLNNFDVNSNDKSTYNSSKVKYPSKDSFDSKSKKKESA